MPSKVDADARLGRLRAALAGRGLDRLIVSNLVNVRYLSGFTGTNGVLVIGADDAVLLTDFRYVTQAGEQSPRFEVIDAASEPRKRLAGLLEGRTGFDDAQMSVQSHAALVKALAEERDGDGIELVESAGIVEQLRAVKDAAEIDAIARAAEVADSIYETLAEEGLIGRSEREVAWRIETLARERGAEGLSFPPIVAAGAHGALPHAEPRDRPIERGELVILDLGCVVDGYCSDCTRTFATGELDAEQQAVYELVLEAQQAALDFVASGTACAAVDAAARDVIEAAGHGERFGHGTGHGVGMEVHEQPNVSSRSEADLEPGNVITVEPGVYLDGRFGVRIEDLVVVDGGRSRILSGFPKQLITVG